MKRKITIILFFPMITLTPSLISMVQKEYRGQRQESPSQQHYKQASRAKKSNIWLAVKQGDADTVTYWLTQNKDLANVKDMQGSAPLHYAAGKGNEGIVRLLLEAGAEVDEPDSVGKTSLHWAAGNGHQVIVNMLLGARAHLEKKAENGRTPLIWAAANGHDQVVQLLLDAGADINARDNSKSTSLHWAARKSHEAVVRLLLDKGAKTDAKDRDGVTPVMWALQNNHEPIVRLLAGPPDEHTLYAQRANKDTIWKAAINGDREIVQYWLDQDTNLAHLKNNLGKTPLTLASANGHKDIVDQLVRVGAPIDEKNKDESTPLIWAAANGHEPVVKLLLDAGAQIDLPGASGSTALIWAALSGRDKVVELLLQREANPNIQDVLKGRTPLVWAIRTHEGAPRKKFTPIPHETVVTIIKKLISKGADISIKDAQGYDAKYWIEKLQIPATKKKQLHDALVPFYKRF